MPIYVMTAEQNLTYLGDRKKYKHNHDKRQAGLNKNLQDRSGYYT